MIPREILKKIRLIELCTNRLASALVASRWPVTQLTPLQNKTDSTFASKLVIFHNDMKKKDNVTYLTRVVWEAFKEEEHRDRVELQQRVERGELTPLEANREASIFKEEIFDPARSKIVNLDEMLGNAAKLRFDKKRNGRRKQKAIRG